MYLTLSFSFSYLFPVSLPNLKLISVSLVNYTVLYASTNAKVLF